MSIMAIIRVLFVWYYRNARVTRASTAVHITSCPVALRVTMLSDDVNRLWGKCYDYEYHVRTPYT